MNGLSGSAIVMLYGGTMNNAPVILARETVTRLFEERSMPENGNEVIASTLFGRKKSLLRFH